MIVMTTVFWTLTWLPQVLSAISQLPQPVNLTLNSLNLHHMLKWRPGPETPAGVHYSVTVITESGTSWVSVSGCERVRDPLVCNLTGAFPDLRQDYLVQVTAWLGGNASQPLDQPYRFKPIRDTNLDPPWLTVTPCGSGLCVDLQPPMEHLRQAYDTLDYKLKVTSDSSEREQLIRSLKEWNITDLTPGRKYCVSVRLSDSLESKKSNYSEPVCVFTTGIFHADPWISAMLCLSVLIVLVFSGLMVFTGFCCLGERPLPLVLTSVHHADGLVVMAQSTTPMSSLLNVKATLPSAGERKNSRSSSEDSEEEGGTESTGDSRPAYKMGAGTGLLSSSSSSSTSLSNCLSPTSDTTSDLLSSLQSEVPVSTETGPSARLNHTLGTDTDREEVEGVDSQDVNLLTLTFGSLEKEEEEEEGEEEHVGVALPGPPSVSEDVSITTVQPSQTWNDTDFAMETTSADEEEEDEDEDEEESGYMGRPCTDTLKRLLK